VHEYLADEGVLSTGIDRLQYQALLVNQVAEERIICLSSGFHHSLIKKRLIMMTKNKPDQDPKLRILSLVPIALFLFVGVACINGQKTNGQKTPQQNVSQTIKSSDVVKDTAWSWVPPPKTEEKFAEKKETKFAGWFSQRFFNTFIKKQKGSFYVMLGDKHLTEEEYMSIDPYDVESISLSSGEGYRNKGEREKERERILNILKERRKDQEYTAGGYGALVIITLKKKK
jgi:hypothetical protein